MNKVMFEVMRYFGLNHICDIYTLTTYMHKLYAIFKQSSGVKWKLNELCGIFILEIQINTEYE